MSGILDWLNAYPLQSAPPVNQEDTVDILREVYAATPNSPDPVAVLIEPHPAMCNGIWIVDCNGRVCGYMGHPLAKELGWIVHPTP